MKKALVAFTALAALWAQAAVELDDAIEYDASTARIVPTAYGPTPVEVNLYSPLQLPCHERSVYGLRWNILYGWSDVVAGLDVGLVGASRGSVYGLQAEVWNYVEGAAYGLQVGALGSYVQKSFCGVQLNGLLSFCDIAEICGVQVATLNFDAALYGVEIGALNWTYGAAEGVVLGAVNVNRADSTGATIGAYNHAASLRGCQIGAINCLDDASVGCQIGVFNLASELKGVQIGLVNVNQRGAVPILPVVNANF